MRARGDLIEMFKIKKGLDTVQWHSSLQAGPPRSGHRGHIRPELVKDCLIRRNAFCNRVARMWNKIPDSVIDAPSVNSFKKRIDDQRTGCS
ncbi:RNA-directed DNA polymerase from mobile element jockey-like [Brachionus plicatilis]|uniref:RNA-directed DNA polymerase from mobile element jockey-like n=1 Tax=Brachionus plicatilis TaxID=10195 RepID=A0A3M7RPN0_BRAPC|nr:RNA-directed DNA polymerase from mobile element jockey-like [Brachionus plicatilis]